MQTLFYPFELESSDIDIELGLHIMKQHLRKHDALRVIKTWCNSWATSARMHEHTLLPCLFGCQDAQDEMAHYVQRPFWLYLLTKLIHQPQPSPEPLTRLGLVEPSIPCLLAVSCSFAGYHAVKRLALEKAFTGSPLEQDVVAFCHRTFFDAFCAAARDCSFHCSGFSSLIWELT